MHVEGLLFGVLGLKRFSIYVQDHGAPVGYRIASGHFALEVEGDFIAERIKTFLN
jgi:hypothetical protein